MTKRETRELFDRALKLPTKDRARLAGKLRDSLEEVEAEECDPEEVERAWGAVFERRLREIEEGRVKPIPHEEAIASVRSDLERARKRRKA